MIDGLVAAAPSRIVEVGDPGVVHDAETPFADLPPYDGPPDPPPRATPTNGATASRKRASMRTCPARAAGSRHSRRPPTTRRSTWTKGSAGARPTSADRAAGLVAAAKPVAHPGQRHRRHRDPAHDERDPGQLRERRPLLEQHLASATEATGWTSRMIEVMPRAGAAGDRDEQVADRLRVTPRMASQPWPATPGVRSSSPDQARRPRGDRRHDASRSRPGRPVAEGRGRPCG